MASQNQIQEVVNQGNNLQERRERVNIKKKKIL